jgi:hypothetical protein
MPRGAVLRAEGLNGLAILLVGIVGLRTLAPDAGISINGLRRRHQSGREGQGHRPSPLA